MVRAGVDGLAGSVSSAMTATELLSHLGPDDFWCIVAVFLFFENRKLQDKVHEMAMSNMDVIKDFKQRIKELAAIIERGFGGA